MTFVKYPQVSGVPKRSLGPCRPTQETKGYGARGVRCIQKPTSETLPQTLPQSHEAIKSVPRELEEEIWLVQQNLPWSCRAAARLELMTPEALADGNPLEDNDACKEVKAQGYLRVPSIFQIGPPEVPDELDDADFSREAINARAKAGKNRTLKALQARQT